VVVAAERSDGGSGGGGGGIGVGEQSRSDPTACSVEGVFQSSEVTPHSAHTAPTNLMGPPHIKRRSHDLEFGKDRG
jgi:hypothetical protein